MQPRYFFVLIAGMVLTTAVEAVEEKADPKNLPEDIEHLKTLGEVNKWNAIFDDYSQGGAPFKPYTLKKEE